jgi:parallel beta-helix repeat protein
MLKIGRYATAVFCIAAAASACGGSGSTAPTTSPPPNPLYVSATTGSDTNLGDQAHPLKSVSRATQLALSGYQIFVGPGTYGGGVTTVSKGTAQQGLHIIADPSGAQTGDQVHAGPVVIDATGLAEGFQLNNSPGSLIDGFTIINATDAGIVLKSSSDNFIIQNCIIHDNPGDGIRVQDSASVLVFNNLVYSNGSEC